MKSKVLVPVVGLMVAVALAGCGGGGGGGGDPATPVGTSPSGNQSPAGSTPPPASGVTTGSGSVTGPTGSTAPVQYTLATTVAGTGTVTITPASSAGIACATASCSNAFDTGTSLTLTAAPASGYTFSGWSGGTCAGSATCAITMSGDKTATATFVAVVPKVTLTVATSGAGSVAGTNVSCSSGAGTCQTSVNQGTVVSLTATPATGYVFSSWSGANGCTASTSCSVTADTAKTVTATFSVQVAAGTGCAIPRSTATTPTFASGHPRIFVNHVATLSCLQQSLTNKAAAATRFQTYVDSEIASPGSNWGFQYWWPALMYQVTGNTKYSTFAIAKVDAMVASEEALIAAGSAPVVAGDSYLDVGGMVGDVALVYDWCYASLTPAQRTRWINYMNQAVSNVWNPTTAKWGNKTFAWSGWSVDNPSNNYYYSFLRATMLAGLATRGENASAQGWIDQFRTNKIANQLLPTFNRDLTGGGSREGTGYGTAMRTTFQLYDWWERSTGERIATLTPHTQASTTWATHNIVPSLDFLPSIGDQARDSTVSLFDYHREYLLGLITLFPQDRMSAVAKLVLDGSSVTRMANGFESWVDYVYQPPALPAAVVTDLSPVYYGSGTGELMMRSGWGDKTAAFSTFMCGPFTESHAHRDQGSFQIFRGSWLAPTGAIFTRSGIEQQEELNNLVRVQLNGTTIKQVNSASPCVMAAVADNDFYSYGVAKVTPVYNGQAAISKMEREYLFIKPSTFVVFDRVGSASGTSRIWTLNVGGVPTVSGDRLSVKGVKYGTTTTYAYTPTTDSLDVFRVAPSGLSYVVSTPVMVEPSDALTYANARRVDVVDTAGTQSNFLHVMGTNASVTAATRSDATGQTGAVITLADGRTVTVRFANTTTGGTLVITKADGTTQVTGSLPTGVATLPQFRN